MGIVTEAKPNTLSLYLMMFLSVYSSSPTVFVNEYPQARCTVVMLLQVVVAIGLTVLSKARTVMVMPTLWLERNKRQEAGHYSNRKQELHFATKSNTSFSGYLSSC